MNFFTSLRYAKERKALRAKLLHDPRTEAQAHALRKEIQGLPPLPKDGGDWIENLRELRNNIVNKDISGFLGWSVIGKTMFHNAKPIELETLKKSSRFIEYSKIIPENWIGDPEPYKFQKNSSGNRIHQIYNLHQIIETGFDFKSANSVFEFGGGYGSLSSLVFGLGFHGTYTIFDFAEFNALQRYYLSLAGVLPAKKINFVSDFGKIARQSPDLFIATWSLSESPLDVREKVLSSLESPKNFLIAFQNEFAGIDNVVYFKKFTEDRPGYEWSQKKIPHLGENFYLIGRKK